MGPTAAVLRAIRGGMAAVSALLAAAALSRPRVAPGAAAILAALAPAPVPARHALATLTARACGLGLQDVAVLPTARLVARANEESSRP